MRNVTKDNITDVFMGYMGDDADPRLREVLGSLVKHLHAFAKDVNLTHAVNLIPVPGHWGTLPLSMKGAPNGTTATEIHRRL